MPLIHTVTLAPNEKAARNFRAAFSTVMNSAGLSDNESNKFLLAMSEVVTNLQKHTRPAPKHVRVTLHRLRAQWRLTIADDGPPFTGFREKAELASIADLNEDGRGLYLVHSQFPDFKYEPGTRSNENWNTLTLTLPFQSGSLDLPKAAIIDDDPVFLEVIKAYLEGSFSVICFQDANKALQDLSTNVVDLVISDIRMPGIDGYMFRRSLQNGGNMNTVPFIFITGADSPSNREMAAELSIDDYLTKPIDKQQLISTIRRVMKRAANLRDTIGDRLDVEITDALRPGFQNHPNGFQTAVAHEAATAGGGDILIERELEQGHLIIFADIMGHGEQAKFFAHAFTGYAYGAIRALSKNASPKVLLSELSDLFLSDRLLKNSFATALALMVYPDGKISFAAAGHPPPFILTQNGFINLEISGPLLGLMEEPEYTEIQHQLPINERLVLFTDGISEAGRTMITQPADLFDTSPTEMANWTDQKIADALLSFARSRSNYFLHDDATVIVIRKTNDK